MIPRSQPPLYRGETPGLSCSEYSSVVREEFQDSCDIRNIFKRACVTGALPCLAGKPIMSALDFMSYDFQDLMHSFFNTPKEIVSDVDKVVHNPSVNPQEASEPVSTAVQSEKVESK